MINKSNALADRLGMDVIYLGMNGVGQHLFGNGTSLVTDIYDTLESAVDRFGKRIKFDERTHRMSAYFREGYAATKFELRPGMNRLEKIEYGAGYLKRLVEQHEKAKAALPPKKEPDTRLPHEVLADRAKAIQKMEGNKPPYTPEQLRNTPYVGTAAERAAAPVAKSVMADSIANIAKRRGRPPKAEAPIAPAAAAEEGEFV